MIKKFLSKFITPVNDNILTTDSFNKIANAIFATEHTKFLLYQQASKFWLDFIKDKIKELKFDPYTISKIKIEKSSDNKYNINRFYLTFEYMVDGYRTDKYCLEIFAHDHAKTKQSIEQLVCKLLEIKEVES